MKRLSVATYLVGLCALVPGTFENPASDEVLRFEVELTAAASSAIAELGLAVPVVGRVYVIISRDDRAEPRLQLRPQGVPFWGKDVRGLGPGGQVVLSGGDDTVVGYPLASIDEIPHTDGSLHWSFQRAMWRGISDVIPACNSSMMSMMRLGSKAVLSALENRRTNVS